MRTEPGFALSLICGGTCKCAWMRVCTCINMHKYVREYVRESVTVCVYIYTHAYAFTATLVLHLFDYVCICTQLCTSA